MKPIFSLVLLLLLSILSACGGTLSVAFDTPPAPPAATTPLAHTAGQTGVAAPDSAAQAGAAQPAQPLLTADTDPETLRRALLDSHENWQTLWADGLVLYNGPFPNGSERVQIWVDRPTARFRVLSGPVDGQPERVQVSDGRQQARIDLPTASRQVQDVSPAARTEWQAPLLVSDTIEPHPLDMEIDSLLSEILFPAALAERSGSFQVEGAKELAGRPALYATWWWDGQMRQSFWIDAQTALILRMDAYEKQGESSQPLYSVLINEIHYDLELPESLFALELAETPRFALNPFGGSGPAPEAPAAVFTPGEGALYFVIRGAEGLQLAWLPGGCVRSGANCPAPVVEPGYPNLDRYIQPLVWSPDGTAAALMVDGSLYVYRPESGEWQPVALFPVLTGQPLWSPDGGWLIFTVLNGADQELYAVRANGADLTRLSSGPLEAENIWLEGWLADGRLLLSLIAGNSARAYALEFVDGASTWPPAPLAGFESPYRVLGISPDGQQIATSSGQGSTVQIELVHDSLDGQFGGTRRLATFQNSSVSQLLFAPGAPDPAGARWMAFVVRSGGSEAAAVSTLYAIRADGSDLRQLYQSENIGRAVFSGDGTLLVVEGGDNGRLAVVPLEGAARMLDAPGLRLDQPLSAVSWR